jgi:hypothetical protein
MLSLLLLACTSNSQFQVKGIDHPISVINGANKADAHDAVHFVVSNLEKLKEKYSILGDLNIQEIQSVSKSHRPAKCYCELWVNFNNGIGSTSICLIKNGNSESDGFEVLTLIESTH